jgi:hypothetical protein
MRFPNLLCRNIALYLTLCCASLLSAKVVWLVGEGAEINATMVAPQLEQMLGEEVEVIPFTWLSVWANTTDPEGTRAKALAAETFFVTPAAKEPKGLTFLALTTLKTLRPRGLKDAAVVAVQKPVYKMSGLCRNDRLQATVRLALGTDLDFVALPKVWQQVYTDDTFYNGKVPKGEDAETYVAAAALAMTIKGVDYTPPALSGVHPELAEDLVKSIRKGLKLREDVLYAAAHLPASGFDVRVGSSFDAILYDGAFERKIGAWLETIAAADGRKLTLHYTTDTLIDTGWPCLFRTTHKLGDAPKASVYTRPAFEDDTGLTELQYLANIYKADVNKPGWMPFPLAIAEWVRRYPNTPVYEGAMPTDATAAMFASMLYLKWTGAAVLPQGCDQRVTTAIAVGLEVMLRQQRLHRDVNAIFCRPLGNGRFAFSLWRKPADKVTINLAADQADKKVSEKKLIFTKANFWSPQIISVDTPSTLYWKISAKDFPGQNTGARALD